MVADILGSVSSSLTKTIVPRFFSFKFFLFLMGMLHLPCPGEKAYLWNVKRCGSGRSLISW